MTPREFASFLANANAAPTKRVTRYCSVVLKRSIWWVTRVNVLIVRC
jgi:hypothetical protein